MELNPFQKSFVEWAERSGYYINDVSAHFPTFVDAITFLHRSENWENCLMIDVKVYRSKISWIVDVVFMEKNKKVITND